MEDILYGVPSIGTSFYAYTHAKEHTHAHARTEQKAFASVLKVRSFQGTSIAFKSIYIPKTNQLLCDFDKFLEFV